MSKPRLRPREKHPRIDVTGYAGQWVALDPRGYQIAGHAASPERASEMALRAGVDRPLLYFVPESDAFFIGVGM